MSESGNRPPQLEVARSSRFAAQLRAATAEQRVELVEQLATYAADQPHTVVELVSAVKLYGLARPALRQYLYKDEHLDAAEGAVLVAIAFRIGSFRAESKFSTWLYSVARNEAKQFLRGEQRHKQHAAQFDTEDVAESFVASVSSMVVDQSVVDEAIDNLSGVCRQALILREKTGLTYEELADQLGVPLSTAKTRVRRARAELAAELTGLYRPQ